MNAISTLVLIAGLVGVVPSNTEPVAVTDTDSAVIARSTAEPTADEAYWKNISAQIMRYRSHQQFEEAFQLTKRVRQERPGAVGLMEFWDADIFWQQGRLAAALTAYERVERRYGLHQVNGTTLGELSLRQASRVAIQMGHPARAARYERRLLATYPLVDNPEFVLARVLAYTALQRSDLPIATLGTLLHDGQCSLDNPCIVQKKKIIRDMPSDLASVEALAEISGMYFRVEQPEKNLLGKAYQLQSDLQRTTDIQNEHTCSVPSRSAFNGFVMPMEVTHYGYSFMSYPAGDGKSYHPGVDLNGAYDAGWQTSNECDINQGLDSFGSIGFGCVLDAATNNWGSMTIAHYYSPYEGEYDNARWVSQYGHADHVYVSAGMEVDAWNGEPWDPNSTADNYIGSIGGIENYACHLHLELREEDHPTEENADYWTGLTNQGDVGKWYEDPETFIAAHPGYEQLYWFDESAKNWTYFPDTITDLPAWQYVGDKGNGDDKDENDLKYTTTSATGETASAHLSFIPETTGDYSVWMFVPWTQQNKSTGALVTITNEDGASVGQYMNFYGEEAPDDGCGDVFGSATNPGKRCEEWVHVATMYMLADTEYTLNISNATGESDRIIVIDDILFIDESDEGLPRVEPPSTTSDSETPCAPPSSGSWVIQSDCIFSGVARVHGNLLVENNASLTIAASAQLDVDFINYNITVRSGSSIYIREGGVVQ